jgi:hypothetical protein
MSLLRAACLALTVSLVSVAACGDGKDTKTAHITPGPMPEGENWTGVYFHEVYGYLHMQEEGTNIVGKWKSKTGDKCGTLSGTFHGNVLHYQWKEHTIGLVGASADRKGKGYFVYKLDKEQRPVLEGQFGLNDEEVGSDWSSMKQPRLNPDLKSITCEAEGMGPNAF